MLFWQHIVSDLTLTQSFVIDLNNFIELFYMKKYNYIMDRQQWGTGSNGRGKAALLAMAKAAGGLGSSGDQGTKAGGMQR